jgi:hypothetical protein
MLYRFVIPRAPKAPEEPAVRRHRHNSWSDGRLVRQRSKATPTQNEHSHPLPLTLILTRPAPNQNGDAPLLASLARSGKTNARSAALDVDVAFARVERTLLSVAFDLDLDLDLDFDLALDVARGPVTGPVIPTGAGP